MKKYLPWIATIGFTASLIVVAPAAFAQGGWGMRGPGGGGPGGGAMGVVGTVTAVNGNTVTVTSRMRGKLDGDHNVSSTPVTFSVDATNAKILKNGTSSGIAAIAVNDMVMVQGTVSGTNVAATVIRDGMPGPGPGMMGGRGEDFFKHGSSTQSLSPIQGNGQPIVGGNITAINGNVITVTTASNIIYAVDAANAKFIKQGTSTPLSAAVVGDSVIVQGTVNGTAVTASSIIDQGSGVSSGTPTRGPPAGFFGAIGNFFKHLFGF